VRIPRLGGEDLVYRRAVTDLATALAAARLVDLTQPLGPATVLWPGSQPFRADVEATHERDRVYYRHLSVPEHAGTHFDAPSHFAPEGINVEAVPIDTLVRPVAVLDVRDVVGDERDCQVPRDAIERLEERDGRLEPGAVAAFLTGWDRHRHDARAYAYAEDGSPSLPGLHPELGHLLVERGIVGVAIDTLSVDAGRAVGGPFHRVTQPAGIWHAEGLVGLERLPARGAWLVVAPLMLVDGSGTPARVFAIVP
jgi:kynurenine formamidase